MLHHGQSLPFRGEARHHFLGVHAGFDQLERHLAANRMGLLSQPHRTHAALAEPLYQTIGADGLAEIPGRGFATERGFTHSEGDAVIGADARFIARTRWMVRHFHLRCHSIAG